MPSACRSPRASRRSGSHRREEVEREIATLREQTQALLEDPALPAAAAQDASATERRLASERLAKFVDRPGSTLLAATLITGKGVRAEFGPAGDLRELPAGVLVAGLASLPGDPVRILVVGTSDGDAGPARTLVTAASVPALLAAATPKAELPGRVLRVADSGGLVLAESTGPFDPSALPGEVLDLATMAAHDSDGRTEINLPGIEGWHVVVAAPIPLIEMPVQALAALGAMLVLLVVFTMWMARQILRPARALGLPVAPPRAVRECPRGGPPRQPDRARQPPRVPAVARMVEGARRYGTGFSLVLMDIDEFKRINDTKGHATGDLLLAEVGALIGATIRHTDTAFGSAATSSPCSCPIRTPRAPSSSRGVCWRAGSRIASPASTAGQSPSPVA